MLDLATIAFVIVLAIGWSLFRKGWYGRAVDNHPWCRRCKFDLHTVWPGAPQCPECGTDLAPVGTVELGRRVKRPWLTTVGILILLGCAFWFTQAARQTLGQVNWIIYKTDWWLTAESGSKNDATARAALIELTERISRNEVSASQVGKLIDVGLRLQSEDDVRWSTNWYKLIETAWVAGMLDAEDSLQLVQNLGPISLYIDPAPIRQWNIFSPSVFFDTSRVDSRLWGEAIPLQVTLDNVQIPVRHNLDGTFRSLDIPLTMPPGEHRLAGTWRLSWMPIKPGATPAAWDADLATTITVVSPAPDARELATGEDIDKLMRQRLSVHAVGLRSAPDVVGNWITENRISVIVTLQDAPTIVYLQIEAGYAPFQQGQSGWNLTELQLVAHPESSIEARGFLFATSEVEPALLNVRVHPSLAPEGLLGVSQNVPGPMWYGASIDFTNVPISWYDSIDDPAITDELRHTLSLPPGSRPLPGSYQPGIIRKAEP